MNSQARVVEEGLAALPVMDIHTHLVGGRLGARGLHDVLLYHMVISDLYAAGCPSGARLTQYPGWANEAGAAQTNQRGSPFLPPNQKPKLVWGVRLILRDLYGW